MDALDSFSGSFNDKLVQKAQDCRIPISGTFELLPNCNMHCRMCYIQHAVPHEQLQPVDFWVDIYRRAIEQGMLYSLLTGGEPLLYPAFFSLLEKLSELPAYTCLNTNATLMDREIVSFLAKHPPKRINISLYGASNETYERLCGNPKGYDQVTRAFSLLREADIPFVVHGVMVPENKDDYEGIVETCNRYKVKLSMANYMFPSYRKEQEVCRAECRFNPGELAQNSLRYMKDHYFNDDRALLEHIDLFCKTMENPKIFSLYNDNSVACRAGRCTFWVDWRGNISPCGMHNQQKIDLHQVPFETAWGRIVETTDKIRISEKCKVCKFRCICPICPAAGFCETGRIEGTPEYLCAYCEAYAKLLNQERDRLLGKE